MKKCPVVCHICRERYTYNNNRNTVLAPPLSPLWGKGGWGVGGYCTEPPTSSETLTFLPLANEQAVHPPPSGNFQMFRSACERPRVTCKLARGDHRCLQMLLPPYWPLNCKHRYGFSSLESPFAICVFAWFPSLKSPHPSGPKYVWGSTCCRSWVAAR